MSACPFCFEKMSTVDSKGLELEKCGSCGAVWVGHEPLEKLVGSGALDALLEQARNNTGECKDCQRGLRSEQSCPQCGRHTPTCPQCGLAPLPLARVAGVTVEVCTGCRGIGLDAGELEQLRVAARRDRLLDVDFKPNVQQAAGAPLSCVECGRLLKPEQAFVWAGRAYDGSCAPPGAMPMLVRLSKKELPSEYPRNGDWDRDGFRGEGEAIEGGLVWFFNKLFG